MPPKAKSPSAGGKKAKASPAGGEPKSTPKKNTTSNAGAATKASAAPKRVVLTESLLATDAERHATSKSLYGDTSARISSNVYSVHDRVRHRAYEALFRSVKGKSLLHLGCGMGLYSMLAARAGATHVVAIDTSAVVDPARVVAEQNGLSEQMTFLRGRLRDVLQQLPVKKFDVVLCEWMGTFLLNEEILSDVLYARDNLLAENGVLCPSHSSLHVVGVSDYSFRMDTEDFWSNVYGFTMEPMKTLVRKEVEMCSIPAENIMTSPHLSYTVEIEKIAGLTPEEKADYEAVSSTSSSGGGGGSSGAADDASSPPKDTPADENPVAAKWVPTAVAQKGIECEFTLVATRNCTIHYLTFYVDASFTSKVDTGANFVLGIRPGGTNAWTEVSVGLLSPLPLNSGEKVTGRLRAFTPLEKGGRATVVQVSAKTEGKVAPIETTGEYLYQSY